MLVSSLSSPVVEPHPVISSGSSCVSFSFSSSQLAKGDFHNENHAGAGFPSLSSCSVSSGLDVTFVRPPQALNSSQGILQEARRVRRIVEERGSSVTTGEASSSTLVAPTPRPNPLLPPNSLFTRKEYDLLSVLKDQFLLDSGAPGISFNCVKHVLDDRRSQSYSDLFTPGLNNALQLYVTNRLDNHPVWKQLSNRSTAWFSRCSCPYSYGQNITVQAQPFPPWLNELTNAVTKALHLDEPPNCCNVIVYKLSLIHI